MAHHIAAWLGIPIGIVIAAMVILRKRGMELRARRQQAREASRPAPRQRPDDAGGVRLTAVAIFVPGIGPAWRAVPHLGARCRCAGG